MANQEQLERLLDGGVEEWNKWRLVNAEVKIDLSGAILRESDLRDADLSSANLCESDLHGANLIFADLSSANLSSADLSSADLGSTDLSSADLNSANLDSTNLDSTDLRFVDFSFANLHGADLRSARLSSADLSFADLRSADLRFAKFRYTKLLNTNFSNAIFDDTTFSSVYLLNVIGLDKAKHVGPSELGQGTLQFSQGLIPENFLKGCGFSPWEILAAKLHNPKLTSNQITDIIYEMDRLRNEAPLQVHNLFISYSHDDARFVDRIGELFDDKDVRYWRDMKDATAGPLDEIVVRAMRQNPTVLLIFSQHSVNSDWVEFELEKARELEKEMGRYVICPVALDDSWQTAKWSPKLLTQIKKYHILDFSRWEDATFLETQFTKLLNGLHLFYKEDRKKE